MEIMRKNAMVKADRWTRLKYCLTSGLGENGAQVTGSKEHIALSRRAAQEGMVLLENNGILPLKKVTTVSLFGIGSLDYVKGGGGSGMVYSAYYRNLYEGFMLKNDDFKVYEPVTKFYYDYAVARLHEYDENRLFEEIDVPAELVTDAAQNSDVAIISIHRFSGEGWDRSASKGDFYLTDTEQKMVDDVTAAFDHSVVVLNVGGMVDVSWIKNNPKIDAALLAWQAGMEGGLATADILCGDVNPSGKLVDTFAKTFADYPSADTFHESEDYVCYYEDIYVGYRYFETIPGMKEKVNYPFGYGLSYTTFEISKPVAVAKDGKIEISVSVKNTGKVAGKEVVQIYYSAPQGVLGKSAIELAAFKKSRLLEPGETEEMTIAFDIKDMASYDDLGKLQMSAYVLEKGEYRFFAGNNCRDLIEAEYRYTVEDKFIVTEQLTQKCAPNKLEKRMLSDGTFEPLPSFPIEEHNPAPFKNEYEVRNTATPLYAVAEGKMSLEEFVSQLTNDELILLMSGIPARGLSNTCGLGGIDRLGIPPVMTTDGPAGVRIHPNLGVATTCWPCSTMVACTWNPELSYEIGKAGGLEVKENGMGVWLTPALNIHRNPLCGRNFEYYSEDPLIAGKFAAAKVSGMQSVGVAATPKHFACNNKETKRTFSDSRVSERALREIYLRGFEICVKEADPWGLMNSYNIINGRRCCESYEQMEGILRGEWGFSGMVTTDWGTPEDHKKLVRNGNDLSMPWGYPDQLRGALFTSEIQRGHLEARAMNVLGLILRLE